MQRRVWERFPERRDQPYQGRKAEAIIDRADYRGVGFVRFRSGMKRSTGFVMQQVTAARETDIFTLNMTRWSPDLIGSTRGFRQVAQVVEERTRKKGLTIVLG